MSRYLSKRGFDVVEAPSLAEAERSLGERAPDLVLLDERLPDGSGLDLLPRLRTALPHVAIVVLTGHGSIELAVRAIKEGADQFLTKPVDMEALLMLVARLLDSGRDRRKVAALRGGKRPAAEPFFGMSPAMRQLEEEARALVESHRPVLILGETGSGKGVLARWLHARGPRADEAFVDLNCAGLTGELLDSELFGHEQGAFTGAQRAKQGLLEVAHRGTAFLDEIGDMPTAIQPRLLKVLEDGRFRRVGDVRDRSVDVRLIAATHQDLRRLCADGRFREDLYFRISTLQLRIPPLRERPEDIPALAQRLLVDYAHELGRPLPELSAAGLRALQRHVWPGNVRELRNVLEAAALRQRGGAIEPAHLRLDEAASAPAAALAPADGPLPTLAAVERAHIERVLAAVGGRVTVAAEVLDVSTSALYEKLKRLEIPHGRALATR
ncbi:MAG: sigma-54 dependent transcriptional regulator [Vicinamibacteria bacterium]|nr:sigma-54 dependent transcriptional regulator [Vicinamibacteria bacterium]